MHVRVEAKGRCQVSSSNIFTLLFSESLSLNLELTNSARHLASEQQASSSV